MHDLIAADCGIRQLHVRYADAVWRKDADAFAACFTPKGEWRISGMLLKGRAEIAETIAAILSGAERVLIRFQTPLIALGPDGVTARTYVNEQCSWQSRAPNISIGRYYERFARDGDTWLFDWRLFQILYSGPADLSGTYHDQPDFGAPPGMPPADLIPGDHARAKWKLPTA